MPATPRSLIVSLLQTSMTRRESMQFLNQKHQIYGSGVEPVVIFHLMKLHEMKPLIQKGAAEICSYISKLGYKCVVVCDQNNFTASKDRQPSVFEAHFAKFNAQFAANACLFEKEPSPCLHESGLKFICNAFKSNHTVLISPNATNLQNEIIKLNTRSTLAGLITSLNRVSDKYQIEKIVVVDPEGGLRSQERGSSAHVFVNLLQELKDLQIEYKNEKRDFEWVKTANACLSQMPDKASFVLMSPEDAFHRNQFLLSHILTNKPIVSPSLPYEHLKSRNLNSTVIRMGYPLQIFGPNDLGLHYHKLFNLIDESFGKKLDREKYHHRLMQQMRWCIVVGDYEGCAIVTTETLLNNQQIPYLDKFAVKKSNYGHNNMADVCFTQLVKLCPEGLLWRSRENNPINHWYFERSRITLNITDTIWKMFFTSRKNIMPNSQQLSHFKQLVANIDSSWSENLVADMK